MLNCWYYQPLADMVCVMKLPILTYWLNGRSYEQARNWYQLIK